MSVGEEVPLFYSEQVLEDAVWRPSDKGCNHAGANIHFPYDDQLRDLITVIKIDLTDIPSTATIIKANLRFQASQNSLINSTVAELFVLSAEENSVYLTNCHHQSMKAQSHYGPVEWVIQQWTINQIYHTPDFGSLLSPVIKSKSGSWRTYAYVVLTQKSGYSGSKTNRKAYSVNNDNSKQKPRIELEYFDKTPGK